ncbi:hypothetical protein N7535_006604 [Penicillium sp. DV-2018c]|nr:hypothetical protein N7461_007311 [Penicillium sp. DV-2018c]KAJ5567298.1 hypothetical protein N7535_006604 [Penicillium sp. DV-2018c]
MSGQHPAFPATGDHAVSLAESLRPDLFDEEFEEFVRSGMQPTMPDWNAADTTYLDPSIVDQLLSDDNLQFGGFGEIGGVDEIDSIIASAVGDSLPTSHSPISPPSLVASTTPTPTTHASDFAVPPPVHAQHVRSGSTPAGKVQKYTFIHYDPQDPNKHEPCERVPRDQEELVQQRVDAAALKKVGGACECCRRAKKKCDTGRPCGHCRSKNRPCHRESTE